MTQLPASTFHGILRYLEAIRERQRMRYYTSCWDLAVVQRREAVALSAHDISKSDFLVVEQELQLVMCTEMRGYLLFQNFRCTLITVEVV